MISCFHNLSYKGCKGYKKTNANPSSGGKLFRGGAPFNKGASGVGTFLRAAKSAVGLQSP